MADEVILCASELAANAALHSDSRLPGGTFTLRAEISRGHHARIEIENNGGPWTSATADSTEPLAAGQREVSPLWGGSLARCLTRYLQRPGPPPHDLDVLVVGRPGRGLVYDAADRAQQRLGMPVNPVIRAAEAWRDAADPLIQQIQSGPFVMVLVPDDATDEEPSPTVGAADG